MTDITIVIFVAIVSGFITWVLAWVLGASDALGFKKIAEDLWQLLDDIDTASDVAKANDVQYRSLVQRIHMKRFEYADSNGKSITWKK